MKKLNKKILLILLPIILVVGLCSCVYDPLETDLQTRNIYPITTNLYDIGSPLLQYQDGYFQNLYLNGVAINSSQWVTDANGITYDAGNVAIGTPSEVGKLLLVYDNHGGLFSGRAVSVESNNASAGNTGVYISIAGAKTGASYGEYITNSASSSTNAINKYGLFVRSTGLWNGAGATNYGVYIEEPTDGTNNYAFYSAGGLNYFNGITTFGSNTKILSDLAKAYYGSGDDMTVWYDGTNGNINTSDVAASDLNITTGANKTIELQNPVWNDIITSPLNLRPGITPPTFAVFMNGIYGMRFGAGTGDELHGTIEIPHDYKEGTDLIPHVHWSPTTTNTGNIVWGLEYTFATDGAVFPGSTIITTVPEAASGTVNNLEKVDFPTISGATMKIGDIVAFRIYRQNGGTDTFTGDAFLHSFGFHYQTDTIGSRHVTVK